MFWTQDAAVAICRDIEAICPIFGYHVALTGGTLYKEGERKDLDILFYSVRQNKTPDRHGLIEALGSIGFSAFLEYGWMNKAKHAGRNVDIFFPETPKSDADGSSGKDRK